MRPVDIPVLPSTEIEIPVELSALRELIYNLWWSWSTPAHRLFHSIDETRWLRYRNPVQLLINLDPHGWKRLLLDDAFMERYHEVVDAFEGYMSGGGNAWFPRNYPSYAGGPIAYFSTEFGWHDCLGIYSGGLGVLSGDHCKSASDLGLPLVGIGLMYRRGYFRQTIDRAGLQQHFYPDFDLGRLPIRPVVGTDGKPLLVEVEFPRRQVSIRVWKAQVGRVPVLLLDTDVPENAPSDRPITSILYVQGREMRLCQEIVLGIGGLAALRAAGVKASVWHMNEGHSALLALERIRERMEEHRIPFHEALRRTSGNAVFTTHTPVPAGNETFDNVLIRRYFAATAQRCDIPMEELLALGAAGKRSEGGKFNFTALAIRTSNETNGVSELHGRVADEIWSRLLAERSGDKRAVRHITNGVHTPTWMGPELRDLLEERIGAGCLDRLLDPGFEQAVMTIPDAELWDAHVTQKKRLFQYARERIREQYARHGRAPDDLHEVDDLLDPTFLTIGFARRFATYKRATLIFRDMERLRGIVGSSERPVQILFAGKAHPADRPGQRLIREICEASLTPNLQGRILFLENYSMRMARYLVQGVDLWLNNPRYPQEASGTSGMKVAVNAGLNCSVLDGWWCEGYDPSHGWAFGQGRRNEDFEDQDREDSEDLYRVLSEEVVPCFYRLDEATGLPSEWISRMKKALALLAPRFSTDRMVRDYAEKLYLPASRRQGWGSEFDEVRLWTP
jgi:starch phosphorylase